MSKTVTRLFDNHADAVSALNVLEGAGIDENRISLISNNADNWHEGHKHHKADLDDNETAEGAGQGAGTGGVIGGAAGLMAGLGMLAIPGLGPVVAAGWLAATAVGAGIGAVAGAATGGILGALKDAGHSDDEAHVYAESVRRGGSLVSVKVRDEDEAMKVESLLDRNSGINALDRGKVYREAGWASFDDGAAPYSADQVREERARYAETRSFSATDPYTNENDLGGDSLSDRPSTIQPGQNPRNF